MKQFAVIGLGTFGQRVARTLMQKGSEVVAVDRDAAKVEAVKDDVTRAICLDATDEDTLAHSGVLDLDAVVVAMGEHMEEAILATALLKRLGAGYIVARAASELYAQILRDVGADRTVLIEEQMADQVAKTMVAPDILDQLQLSTGHSRVEMKPLRDMVGKKLGELDIRRNPLISVSCAVNGGVSAWGVFPPPVAQKTVTVAVTSKNAISLMCVLLSMIHPYSRLDYNSWCTIRPSMKR